jgi:DNA-binding NtrC family response regulator
MADSKSYLTDKYILVVDDEEDILETIEEILDNAKLDLVGDYHTASEKIKTNKYDLAILDIMGVNGMQLLEEAVQMNIPAVMLTAHAMNTESLMESIRKGAISYIPKDSLSDIETLLGDLLKASDEGNPPWKMLFDKVGPAFNRKFGANWKEADKEFWADFEDSNKSGKD